MKNGKTAGSAKKALLAGLVIFFALGLAITAIVWSVWRSPYPPELAGSMSEVRAVETRLQDGLESFERHCGSIKSASSIPVACDNSIIAVAIETDNFDKFVDAEMSNIHIACTSPFAGCVKALFWYDDQMRLMNAKRKEVAKRIIKKLP